MKILDIKEIFDREFNQYRKTLKEISKESKKGPSVVNEQEKLYYHFDEIKETKVYKNASEMPASPDTLILKDDEIIFVEFKNGRIENIKKKKKEIKLKALEGGFVVLNKIVEKHNFNFLDVVQLNKSYILVYNSEKNPMDEIINRSAFIELEAALKIFEGNFFHNVAVIPADVFVRDHLQSRCESTQPGRK